MAPVVFDSTSYQRFKRSAKIPLDLVLLHKLEPIGCFVVSALQNWNGRSPFLEGGSRSKHIIEEDHW